ncbi:methyl transferase [Stachybotrys elegans]|uniref:Methyl transferase n=1 Tax=Stachybotrys elegans TaxID=80388 RepID=A0A8K0SP22_9HYPO|nr:methyl transferase [Stachybotrys elegans]
MGSENSGSATPMVQDSPSATARQGIIATRTTAAENVVQGEGVWQFGHYYGSYRADKYPFPIESEEMSRYDLLHKFFLTARKLEIYSAPLPTDRVCRIMDLGTGTGIWVMNMAEQYLPGSEVCGVDLHKIQPRLIPPSTSFLQFDIEEPSWWLPKDNDLIFMRLLLGSIQTDLWPQVYKNIFDHLAPGVGYIEQVEVDYTPRWDGGEIPSPSAIKEWAEMFHSGLEALGRSAQVDSEKTRRTLEEIGFVDFHEEVVQIHLSPWSDDEFLRNVGRWWNSALCSGLGALSMKPFWRKTQKPEGEVREYVDNLAERFLEEACHLKYHCYMTLHIWTARKPEGA